MFLPPPLMRAHAESTEESQEKRTEEALSHVHGVIGEERARERCVCQPVFPLYSLMCATEDWQQILRLRRQRENAHRWRLARSFSNDLAGSAEEGTQRRQRVAAKISITHAITYALSGRLGVCCLDRRRDKESNLRGTRAACRGEQDSHGAKRRNRSKRTLHSRNIPITRMRLKPASSTS